MIEKAGWSLGGDPRRILLGASGDRRLSICMSMYLVAGGAGGVGDWYRAGMEKREDRYG